MATSSDDGTIRSAMRGYSFPRRIVGLSGYLTVAINPDYKEEVSPPRRRDDVQPSTP